MEEKRRILWADDEIDMLQAHVMFLEERGYDVTGVTNGQDAIDYVKEQNFDVILLDEMMVGKDGLAVLAEIKAFNPAIPVVMITKSEEESLMEEAIGSQIDDYLVKPVNPTQILSACKKLLDSRQITENKLTRDYVVDFREIGARLAGTMEVNDWVELFRKLTEWDMALDKHPDIGFEETLFDQKKDYDSQFGRFIDGQYLDWIHTDERPPLSADLARNWLLPELKKGRPVFFVVLDCMRLDQWMALEPYLYEYFNITRNYYLSILPTATPYARNSIFSGLFPLDIENEYPDLWTKGVEDEHSHNRYEHQLLARLIEKEIGPLEHESRYVKILNADEAWYTDRKLETYLKFDLVALVINFVDILIHRRNESDVLKEIAPDEAAYRSLTCSWFEHSALYSILKQLAKTDAVIILTTDHGSKRGKRAAKVVGDKETSTNLRYKFGRNLKCDDRYAIHVKDPADFRLPRRGINVQYLIAKEDYYLIYPTNFNQFANMYKDSFQHGGISPEENILPVVRLEGK